MRVFEGTVNVFEYFNVLVAGESNLGLEYTLLIHVYLVILNLRTLLI